MTQRIRIGIDTGGTFTDVVAFDETSGEIVTTKTPSTPSNPADGFLAGIDKVLGLLGADGSAIEDYEVTRLAAYGLLRNLNDPSARPDWPFGPVARLLAHTALRRAA